MRTYGHYCSVAKALDAIGDRWSLLIVRELMIQGACRYTDLQNGLPGIATNLLSDRLRDLEAAGVVWREAAAAPVATTLYHLNDAGRELVPVVTELGRWGTRFMVEPTGDEAFRTHWLAFPVSEFLTDREPAGKPLAIEVHTGEQPAVIEVGNGEIRTRMGRALSPDLVIDGEPPVVVGVLLGALTMAEARRRGLRVKGDTKLLARLQPSAALAW